MMLHRPVPPQAELLAVARSEVARKLQNDLAFAARFYRALGITVAMRLRAPRPYQVVR